MGRGDGITGEPVTINSVMTFTTTNDRNGNQGNNHGGIKVTAMEETKEESQGGSQGGGNQNGMSGM